MATGSMIAHASPFKGAGMCALVYSIGSRARSLSCITIDVISRSSTWLWKADMGGKPTARPSWEDEGVSGKRQPSASPTPKRQEPLNQLQRKSEHAYEKRSRRQTRTEER